VVHVATPSVRPRWSWQAVYTALCGPCLHSERVHPCPKPRRGVASRSVRIAADLSLRLPAAKHDRGGQTRSFARAPPVERRFRADSRSEPSCECAVSRVWPTHVGSARLGMVLRKRHIERRSGLLSSVDYGCGRQSPGSFPSHPKCSNHRRINLFEGQSSRRFVQKLLGELQK